MSARHSAGFKEAVTQQLIKAHGPAMEATIRREVAAACAGKTTLSAMDMKILQSRIAGLNTQARNARGGNAKLLGTVPRRAPEANGGKPPNRYGIPNRWGKQRAGLAAARRRTGEAVAGGSRPSTSQSRRSDRSAASGRDVYERPSSAAARPVDPMALTREILEEANPGVVLAMVEQVKIQKERDAEKAALLAQQEKNRKHLEKQRKEKEEAARREKEEEAAFVRLQEQRAAELERNEAAAAAAIRERVQAEKAERAAQVAANRRRKAMEDAEARAQEERQLRAAQAEAQAEREQRAREAERKRNMVARQIKDNEKSLARRAAEKEALRKEDQEMMAAYNKMLEDQDRRRQEAIAAIKARSNVIGDLATKSKEDAIRRAKEEDARMVREAEEARRRARAAEERERRERLEIELEMKKALDAQVAEKKTRDHAAKKMEAEQSKLFKKRLEEMEAEKKEAALIETRRREAYRRMLDRQRESKSKVAAGEVARQKEALARQLEAAADDPSILLEVHARLRKLKEARDSPRY